ncbi:hypothetical protein Q1695_006581 [Nippostrongylus brasiliensis]|nr:hypothetical protein Q1695_006581 [Nippostrongylus brasiliensis]
MTPTAGVVLVPLLLLVYIPAVAAGESAQPCFFPESDVRPFFYEVGVDATPGKLIMESEVDPPDAHIILASVRSERPVGINFTEYFELRSRNSGRFELRTTGSLSLPSDVDQLTLFATVVCNDEAFPLFTIRLRSNESDSPQFYNAPYHIEVNESLSVGDTVVTPVVVVDWDSENYPPRLHLEDSDSPFKVVTEPHGEQSVIGTNKTSQRQPTLVLLKLVKPIKRLPITLKLVAENSLDRTSETSIHIHAKPKRDEKSLKVQASKTLKSLPIALEEDDESTTPVESSSAEDPDNPKPTSTVNEADSKNRTSASNEQLATRFEKCDIRLTMPENSDVGTLVTTLNVLNRKKWTMIDVLNPDGTFEIRQNTGEVFIRDNRIMDRELFTNVELVAEIHGSSHMTPCSRVRVNVELLDVNDNRPAFEQEKYVFVFPQPVLVNGAIGIVRARDIDEGEAGRVSYRLLNDSVPFMIRHKGKDGEIVATSSLDDSEYTLIVEARDNAPPFLRSQVPVTIHLPQSQPTTTATTRHLSGVLTVTVNSEFDQSIPAITTLEPASTFVTEPSSTVHITSPSASRRTDSFPATSSRSTTSELTASAPFTTDQPTAFKKVAVHPTLVTNEKLENELNTSTNTNDLEQDDDYTSEEETEEETSTNQGPPFDFVQPTYYYEVFGTPRDGDVLGRVEARPHAQFYGIDRKMSGFFKVDPDLGEIGVGREVDRLVAGNHSFDISATNGLRTAQTTVTVFVNPKRNRTDAIPRFERDRYVFSINENTPPSVIGVVRAYHVALSQNEATLRYELYPRTSGAAAAALPFRVNANSGEVTSETALDHEASKNYEFKVRACLSVNPNSCGYTSVVVIVVDLNDNAPRFSASEYQISLPSDLPVGSDVITLLATDSDSGINGDVNYAINPPSAVFGIDYHTGVVQTFAPVTESRYELKVEAFDHGDPKQTSVARLTIDVHGTNPSAPVFDKKRYDVSLKSPIRAGAVVAQLHAKDPDPGLEGQIAYKFDRTDGKQMTEQSKFSINEQTGVVSALTPLTAQDGPFELVVVAEDQSTVFKRKAKAALHIEIVGGTQLHFLPLPSTIYISTEKAVGSVVLRASAFTSSSSSVHFRILENEAQFVMDGDLLRVATHLVPGETHLTIRAESDGIYSDHNLQVVVMYDRDKYPVFPQLTYDVDVPIDSHFPLVLQRFDARLLNGTLRYRFFPDGTAPEGLEIDAITGELRATSSYARTPSNHETQFVVVRAVNVDFPKFYSDVGVAVSLVSSTTVRFPHSIYRLQISENVPVGTALFPPIEALPSHPSVVYSIEPAFPLSILQNGTLVVNSPVDLELLPVDQADNLHFIVTASMDGVQSVAKLQLKITDVNEFSPRFERSTYSATVSQNARPGEIIVKVKAEDADRTDGSHLLYRVVGGSGKDMVFIREDGTLVLGEISLKTSDNFDVIVEAVDRSGAKDSTRVVVTLETSKADAPHFVAPSLEWNITEGSTKEFLDVTASDSSSEPNGEIDYRIVEGALDNRFVIEKTPSGRAILKLLSPFDYETTPFHKLTVEAADHSNPPRTATVDVNIAVVNANDNPPIFRRINIEQEVQSDLPIGYPILTLSVGDADHDLLSFSLSGDPACSSLSVDPLGIVSFTKAVSKRKTGAITCVVTATDGVHTSNATLRLNVVDDQDQTTSTPPVENSAPRFAKEVYTVTLKPQTTHLLNVTAVDPDGDVVLYSIEPPEFRNLFAVDAKGELTVRAHMSELKQSMYSFLVVAEDRGKPIMSSFTNIRVKLPENFITAATDNFLEFRTSTEVTRAELPPTPDRPSQGEATTEAFGSSTASSSSPSTTATSEQISSSSIAVRKEVHFNKRKYSYTIRSNANVGTYVGRVEVDDKKGVQLSFEKNQLFSIDSKGRIHTSAVFDGPMKIEDKILATRQGTTVGRADFSVFVLEPEVNNETSPVSITSGTVGAVVSPQSTSPTPTEISASATSAPITQSSTQIEDITITDSTPFSTTSEASREFSFGRSSYFAFVPEGQYTNGIRVSVKPEPLSVNRNTNVRYEIDESTGRVPFFLTGDGQLIIFDVDRETQANYVFPIKASSAEFGVARAMVNVTILDVNDNYPQFDMAPSTVGLYSDVPVGTPIVHFSAHDRDADNFGTVTYGIEESDTPFDVDPKDGTLFVAKPLQTNLVNEFSINVIARDDGRPSLKSRQQINISVFDPAIESPVFPDELPEKVVFVEMQPGSEVATAIAGPTINTRPHQEKILYGLVDDHNGLFKIEDGGRIILNRRTNYGERNQFVELNITAENSHGRSWVPLKIFIEPESVTESTTDGHGPTTTASDCYFPTKIHNAAVLENRSERTRVAKVTSTCEKDGRPFVYSMSTLTDSFELNATSGEIFAIRPLDREKRTFHMLFVDVSSDKKEDRGRVARSNPIVDQAKAKLTEFQTLVVVRVLDENDNPPTFVHVAGDELVATVDWQSRLFSAVLKLEATDVDEHSVLTFSLTGRDHEYFLVNSTSGLVILAKTIADYTGESLRFTAIVSDGAHRKELPVIVYVISPSSALLQLTSELPHSQLDQYVTERTLNELTGLDNRLLAKQPYVDHQGHADPSRSHLFVYAIDRKTKVPYQKEKLLAILENHAAALLSSPSKISNISLLSTSQTAVSTFDFILAVVVVILLLLLFAACCILSSYCKRKRAVATSDREYMVSSKAGPRPYDVEAFSRTTAQRVLSARPLPEPFTNQIEVAVSPIFVDQPAVTTNKDDTTLEFFNSVRERPSLLQSALARQKVNSSTQK